MTPSFQILVRLFLLIHFTLSTDDTVNKNGTYSGEFQLDQNEEIQFTEDSTPDNNGGNEDMYTIHFILNNDNVSFNCNESQSCIQSGKRKIFNCDQNYFNNDENIKNVNYAFRGEYDTQFQNQEEVQKHYLQNKEEKMEDGKLSFFSLMKADKNSINLSENKTLKNEKIKIPQNRVLLDENERKKRKRELQKENSKQYYKTHADKILAKQRAYRENHPEKIKEKRKKYCETHPDIIREQKKKYQENHPEKIKESHKNYYQKNADECKEYGRAYYEGHAETIKEHKKIQRKSKNSKPFV